MADLEILVRLPADLAEEAESVGMLADAEAIILELIRERVADELHQRNLASHHDLLTMQLDRMAADPDIQRELAIIRE